MKAASLDVKLTTKPGRLKVEAHPTTHREVVDTYWHYVDLKARMNNVDSLPYLSVSSVYKTRR